MFEKISSIKGLLVPGVLPRVAFLRGEHAGGRTAAQGRAGDGAAGTGPPRRAGGGHAHHRPPAGGAGRAAGGAGLHAAGAPAGAGGGRGRGHRRRPARRADAECPATAGIGLGAPVVAGRESDAPSRKIDEMRAFERELFGDPPKLPSPGDAVLRFVKALEWARENYAEDDRKRYEAALASVDTLCLLLGRPDLGEPFLRLGKGLADLREGRPVPPILQRPKGLQTSGK